MHLKILSRFGILIICLGQEGRRKVLHFVHFIGTSEFELNMNCSYCLNQTSKNWSYPWAVKCSKSIS